jgi:hypothetical protein
LLINRLYDIDFIDDESIIAYCERISPLKNLHTTAKSLLPSIVEYDQRDCILGLDKLMPSLASIVETLLEEDEDEDEDE